MSGMEYSRAMKFAVTVAFDAFRVATFKTPKHHDLETIIRWLRHVSASRAALKENSDAE